MAQLFQRITHGVYVIGVADATSENAFTAAWVMQTSFDPPMLAVAVHPRHRSYRMLCAGGRYSVNVLEKGRLDLAAHFARSADANKLAGVGWKPGAGGVPLLEEAIAWFECKVIGQMAAGDHELVLGRVIDGRLQRPQAEPLRYIETGDLDGAAALYPDAF
jgi:flavin reductase (DIM6/NTAB) family NADH-FMN oxidoreductase RutF